MRSFQYVIVGGGIGGVACLRELLRMRNEAASGIKHASARAKDPKMFGGALPQRVPRKRRRQRCGRGVEVGLASLIDTEHNSSVTEYVCLVSMDVKLNEAVPVSQVTPHLEVLRLQQHAGKHLKDAFPGAHIIHGRVVLVDGTSSTVLLECGETISFGRLCICTGARPQVIMDSHPCVVGIRDRQSLEQLSSLLHNSRRICIVGNGAVAYSTTHGEYVSSETAQ